MSNFHISSIGEPMGGDAEAAGDLLRLISRADVLGLWPDGLRGDLVADQGFVTQLFTKLAEAGLSRDDRAQLAQAKTATDWGVLFKHALEVTEDSPVPASEWRRVLDTLGEDLLVDLLSVSSSSLYRYSQGERTTPDPVAQRLHFLALVVADLSGSYNDYGIRRWFARSRQALAGQSPLAVLAGGFDPSGEPALVVKRLAGELVGAGAA
jgi:hypothetical protein